MIKSVVIPLQGGWTDHNLSSSMIAVLQQPKCASQKNLCIFVVDVFPPLIDRLSSSLSLSRIKNDGLLGEFLIAATWNSI